MRFSVIIPVFNSELFLKECIDSVLNQSYSDFELILIDDESTDNSLHICEYYQDKDNRIVLVQQKNSGTSVARNKGLELAQGDYVLFMDNDDYWDDLESLEKINCFLSESKADVLMFDCKIKNEKTNELISNDLHIDRSVIINQNAGDALKEVLEKGLISRAVWTKVIRRKLIRENNILFPEGMRNEDTDFTAQLFLYARSYDWLDDKIYVYRKNTGSSQTSEPINYEQLLDLKYILKKSIVNGLKLSNTELKKAYYSYLAFPFSVWLGYSTNKLETKKEEYIEMKPYSRVLSYNYDRNMKILSAIYRVFGYKLTCVALKLWVKKNR